MRGPHAGLKRRRVRWRMFEREQSVGQHACLCVRLFAEEVNQRKVAQVVVDTHRRLRASASNTRSVSSRPSVVSRHASTPRACEALAYASVVGTGMSAAAEKRNTPSTSSTGKATDSP